MKSIQKKDDLGMRNMTIATHKSKDTTSALLAPNENSKSSLINSKIFEFFREAIITIEKTLAQSENKRELYKKEKNNIFENYEVDLNKLNTELKQIERTYEKNKSKSLLSENNERHYGKIDNVSHSLNFHLRKQGHHCDSSAASVHSDTECIESVKAPSTDLESVISSVGNLSLFSVKGEKKKHESRIGIIQNLDKMREMEIHLETQLHGYEGEFLSPEQKYELKNTLYRCRARRSDVIVTMVNTYKPRFSTSTNPNKKELKSSLGIRELGLKIPSIKEMLKNVERDDSFEYNKRRYTTSNIEVTNKTSFVANDTSDNHHYNFQAKSDLISGTENKDSKLMTEHTEKDAKDKINLKEEKALRETLEGRTQTKSIDGKNDFGNKRYLKKDIDGLSVDKQNISEKSITRKMTESHQKPKANYEKDLATKCDNDDDIETVCSSDNERYEDDFS